MGPSVFPPTAPCLVAHKARRTLVFALLRPVYVALAWPVRQRRRNGDRLPAGRRATPARSSTLRTDAAGWPVSSSMWMRPSPHDTYSSVARSAERCGGPETVARVHRPRIPGAGRDASSRAEEAPAASALSWRRPCVGGGVRAEVLRKQRHRGAARPGSWPVWCRRSAGRTGAGWPAGR